MTEVKKKTDKELDAAIAQKYGEDWTPEKLNEDDELVQEWILRLTTGYFAQKAPQALTDEE